MTTVTICKRLCRAALLNRSQGLRLASRGFAVSATRMSDKMWEPVIQYWFGIPEREKKENMKKWFGGGKTVDKEITDSFKPLVDDALAGELKDWEKDVKSTVALIILLDQFTRSIYRGTAKAFAGDERALKLAKKIAEEEWADSHKELLTHQDRIFAYMPYMHAESEEAQAKCVDLFKKYIKETEGTDIAKQLEFNLKFAEDHQMVIGKFKRFPFRNAALGRENTKKEEEFFKETGDEYKW